MTRTEMQIRLIRKLADWVDGIDLSGRHIGEMLELSGRQAGLLIAEGWARAVERRTTRRRFSVPTLRVQAADRPRRTIDQLRKDRSRMERAHLEQHEQRRAHDRIREELHDSRARIITAQLDETK